MDGLLLEQAPTFPGQWAVIALGVVTVLYVAVVRPMRKGKRKDPLERPAAQFSLAQQRAVEREMSNLLVEYEEMLRRMTAQLETRATRLELLINQADERLAHLRAATAATPTQNGGGRGTPPADAAAGADLPESTAPRPADEPARSASDELESSPHHPVYQLADQGRTPRQIAQQLNRPHGEIELILALRPAKT